MGKGLQWRMTLWVGGSVLLLSATILLFTAFMLRDRFEAEMNERMEDAIDWTTRMIGQRMERVEYSTRTMAASVQDYMMTDDERIDSLLVNMIGGLECIDVASLVIHDGQKNIIISHAAFSDEEGMVRTFLPFEEKGLEKDVNWCASFGQGKSFWSPAYVHPASKTKARLLCYSEPVYTDGGVRKGMLCAQIREKWITDIIGRYNVRKDIDIAVYTSSNQCIVQPQDYIKNLDRENLIQEERSIDRLGWRLVFSADRRIISQRLNHVILFMVLTNLLLLLTVAVAILLAVRYVARPFMQEQSRIAASEAALHRELSIAAQTQQELVPHVFPPFPQRHEIDIHACLKPAKQVGGDLYDYFLQGNKIYFCIGDVSGKGAPASLFMAATHYLFRSVASTSALTEAVTQMNLSLCTDNTQCMFVTFWFGCLDLDNGKLEYVNAGHNSPVLIHNGVVDYMAESENMPLGVMEDAVFRSSAFDMNPGDKLFLYTDGLTEAMDINDVPLGDNAVLEIIKQMPDVVSSEIISRVTEQVALYTTGAEQSDDITLLCLEYIGVNEGKD